MNIVEVTGTPIGIPDVLVVEAKEVRLAVVRRSTLEVRTDTGLVERCETHDAKSALISLQKASRPRHVNARAVVGSRTDTDEMLEHALGCVRKAPRW